VAEVVLRNVTKIYSGTTPSVKDISLTVADGKFCVLVGPSGCGKSTLLRMIAGLETVTAGDVLIGGEVVNAREPAERDIAMVFQNYALYPHMSVYDNMAYGLRNRGMAREEVDRRVREAATTLEIGGLLERRPRQLSGGQRQRVAMGRAIVRRPKAFLFDEPLSNLDAKLRVSMRVEIRRLQRAFATTSIYVTHDQLEAMTLGDMLVVMNAGQVEQIGAPLDVYARPATTFVAAFIGAPPMNLMPLRTAARGLAASGVSVPTAGALLGIRPEHLALAVNGGAPPGALALELGVTAVEQVGAESYVYARADSADGDGGGTPEIIIRVPGVASLRPGERVTAVAPREQLHLFAQDGRRLPA
jgi:sn-glycerol 3-phosphate transport system ATP-binding protein